MDRDKIPEWSVDEKDIPPFSMRQYNGQVYCNPVSIKFIPTHPPDKSRNWEKVQ